MRVFLKMMEAIWRACALFDSSHSSLIRLQMNLVYPYREMRAGLEIEISVDESTSLKCARLSGSGGALHFCGIVFRHRYRHPCC